MTQAEQVGEKIIYTEGCFTKKIKWFKGWNRKLAQEYIKRGASVKFVHGLTGKETMVTIDEITPIVVFDYN
ncbi:MAG: hypothetical protein AAB784_00465 [Patescibacteria group bacterium]